MADQESLAPPNQGTKRRWEEIDAGADFQLDNDPLQHLDERKVLLAGQEMYLSGLRAAFSGLDKDDSTAASASDKTTLRNLLFFHRHSVSAQDMNALIPRTLQLSPAAKVKRRSVLDGISALQNQVLTGFVLEKVKKIRAAKLAEHPPVDILDLSSDERQLIFLETYASDPATLGKDMFACVKNTIDLSAIYSPPANASQEVKDIMRKWERTICMRWKLAAETAANIRLRATADPASLVTVVGLLKGQKPDTFAFRQWRGLPVEPVLAKHIPAVKDIPVRRAKPIHARADKGIRERQPAQATGTLLDGYGGADVEGLRRGEEAAKQRSEETEEAD
ncbi:uncharacterized protein LTHEOB_5714 [Neofusicoccum parvum]|nr:uncharacterized protein LTHEOB_5714 [Neofusicoccum parvum]